MCGLHAWCPAIPHSVGIVGIESLLVLGLSDIDPMSRANITEFASDIESLVLRFSDIDPMSRANITESASDI